MLQILTPATTQNLTTLEVARVELGTAGTDEQMTALIARASAACIRFCNRPRGFGRETLRQTERVRPWFSAYPTETASGIALANELDPEIASVLDGDTTLAADEYYLADGVLHRVAAGARYGWCWGGPVVIEYAAGFVLPDTLPPDIEQACLSTMKAWHFGRGRDPYIRSQSAEGVGSVTYATGPAESGGALPAEAGALLAPWRRWFS